MFSIENKSKIVIFSIFGIMNKTKMIIRNVHLLPDFYRRKKYMVHFTLSYPDFICPKKRTSHG